MGNPIVVCLLVTERFVASRDFCRCGNLVPASDDVLLANRSDFARTVSRAGRKPAAVQV